MTRWLVGVGFGVAALTTTLVTRPVRAADTQPSPDVTSQATPPSTTPRNSPTLPTSPRTPAGTNEPLAEQPAPSAEEHLRVDDSPFAHDGHPLAGYHNGLFFLRDHHDNFHLYIQGRLQLDWFSHVGPGVEDTSLKPTLFIRRIRPEVSGEMLGHWRFIAAGDFGATAIDNPRGIVETSAAPPGAAPSATNGRYAAAETTRFQAAATDVFINYRAASLFNVQVGQMDAPFMMENRTSDKYLPFMERSLAVRAIGIPTNKEIGAMFWGESGDRFFAYNVGPFMGDGQNRPNIDARFDVFARAFIHPFARVDAVARDNSLKDAQLGASFRYGSRDRKWVFYDYPAMTTQGAFPFWSPTYAGTAGTIHIIPNADQMAGAAELRLPIGPFDITAEGVYIKNQTREALEGFEATNTERAGEIQGIAYYAMVGYWPMGKRDINGVPGYGNPPRLDWSKSDPVIPNTALQLLAKWEQVALTYQGAKRGGTLDTKNADGDIKVNALSLGANYWATRHVRLSLDYVLDMFPGSAPVKATAPGGPEQSNRNRAVAPGNTLATGINDHARDNAHMLNEILARLAIAL